MREFFKESFKDSWMLMSCMRRLFCISCVISWYLQCSSYSGGALYLQPLNLQWMTKQPHHWSESHSLYIVYLSFQKVFISAESTQNSRHFIFASSVDTLPAMLCSINSLCCISYSGLLDAPLSAVPFFLPSIILVMAIEWNLIAINGTWRFFSSIHNGTGSVVTLFHLL